MTPVEFAFHVRDMTRTNSSSFTDAFILRLMKIRQGKIAEAILKADEDILLIPQETDLVADQRDYPLPSDILSRIKRVEALFNGTDWIPLTEIDLVQINSPISTETNIVALFNSLQLSKGNPGGARFDMLRKSVKIYSGTITAVTDGLRVWCDTYPTAITDLTSGIDLSTDPSTTTHGVPKSLHEPWARGVIIDYKSSRDKPIPLNESELNYKNDLDSGIETLKHGNLDREVLGVLPPPSDRGNNGFNY